MASKILIIRITLQLGSRRKCGKAESRMPRGNVGEDLSGYYGELCQIQL